MNIKTLLALTVALYVVASGSSYAEYKFPPCQGANAHAWNNCFVKVPFPDGTRFEGIVKNGKMNGYGVITFANGERYEGEFKDDKRSGWGVWTSGANLPGQKYVGEFKNDRRDGEGTLFRPDGTIWMEGVFSNDQLVESRKVQPRPLKIKETGDSLVFIKERCKDLGFKPTSKEFGKCVLQLSK